MTEFEIGDDEFEDSIDEQVEEVNTSYDQDQVIGDEPQALNTELSNSEPIDAMTGQDFYDIQMGGQAPRIGEFKEEEHPREQSGKFTSGGGSNGKNDGKPMSVDNLKLHKNADKLQDNLSNMTSDRNKKVPPVSMPGIGKENSTWLAPNGDFVNDPESTDHFSYIFKYGKGIGVDFDLENQEQIAQFMMNSGLIRITNNGKEIGAQVVGNPTKSQLRTLRSFDDISSPISWEIRGTGKTWGDVVYGGDVGDGFKSLSRALKTSGQVKESLNKDGTGIVRATRGINPNNPKYDLMKFIYVSSSDCPICKRYDGKVFHKDDPDRPIIPRLESGYKTGDGYAGSNYTHPHCKCKWTYVFRESTSNEFEMDNPEPFARAAKMAYDKLEKAEEDAYDVAFDSMTDDQRDMYNQLPNAEYENGELKDKNDRLNTSQYLEIISAVNGNENEGKPFSEWTKDDLYKSECQMCGATLGEHPNVKDQESHEFMPEYPTDYEGDMSPANEGGNGSGKNGHQRWMLGAEVGQECENCMMITEYKDGKCMICSN